MKPINTNAIMNANRDLIKAQNNKSFAEEFRDRWPADYDKAVRRVAEAEMRIRELSTILAGAIKEAEGRATARTITVQDILDTLTEIENHIDIPKTRMKGIRITADPNAQKFPSAYKYTPESTHFDAEHNGKYWKITNIYRDTCHNTKVSITLTNDAKSAIIDRASIIH